MEACLHICHLIACLLFQRHQAPDTRLGKILLHGCEHFNSMFDICSVRLIGITLVKRAQINGNFSAVAV